MKRNADVLFLGCGPHWRKGWVNVDFASTSPHVYAHELTKDVPFRDDSFLAVYHNQLLETFSREQGEHLLRECLRVLQPGGVVRIVTADLEALAQRYLLAIERGRTAEDSEAVDHEQAVRALLGCGCMEQDAVERLWTYDEPSLARLLLQLGFEDVRQTAPQDSRIPGFAMAGLEPDEQGAARCPEVLCMEARKPAPAARLSRRPLKVVHLCAMNYGGAGNAAVRLHEALRGQGMDSRMYCLRARGEQNTIYLPPLEGELPQAQPDGSRYSPHWDLAEKRRHKRYRRHPQRPSGLELFSDPFAKGFLHELAHLQDADVINFHWIVGMVDLEKDLPFLQGRKIVWTMHDMNPFTGGCHYSFHCDRYASGCGCCWQLGSQGTDESGEFLRRKIEAYSQLDITLVPLSHWLASCAGRSKALGNAAQRIIQNSLPLDSYKPMDQAALRQQLGIPEEAKVLLFGTDSNTVERKGWRCLRQALEQLARSSRNDLVLATFGDMLDLGELPLPHVQFGRLANPQQVAMACNVADVFAVPSLEDNLPNTVMESLACGTPVAAFDVGGLPDMIDHGTTGWLAPVRDSHALAEGVLQLLKTGGALRRRCRAMALERWAPHVQAARYVELYQSLLE